MSLARCRPGERGGRAWPRPGEQRQRLFAGAAAMSALAKASGALKSVDYEVFGRVQGENGLRGAEGVRWLWRMAHARAGPSEAGGG